MMLPERIQVCPKCGAANTITQGTWRSCCLLNFDFGGDTIGLRADVDGPREPDEVLTVQLYLQRSAVDENGVHYLTARCVTLAEFDAELDALRHNLRELRKQAKRLLR